jgi:hypothetical protein
MWQRTSFGALVATMGCVQTTSSGALDGQEVPLEVSMYVEDADALEADGLLTIVLSSLPNACRVYEYYLDASNGQDSWRSTVIGWQKAFPTDFWEVSITLRTNEFGGSLSGRAFNGLPWDALLEANNQVYSRAVHYIAHPLPDDPDDTSWRVEYLSNGGTLEIVEHAPATSVEGSFTAPYVDPEAGAPKGDLEMSFRASVCPNIAAFGF